MFVSISVAANVAAVFLVALRNANSPDSILTQVWILSVLQYTNRISYYLVVRTSLLLAWLTQWHALLSAIPTTTLFAGALCGIDR